MNSVADVVMNLGILVVERTKSIKNVVQHVHPHVIFGDIRSRNNWSCVERNVDLAASVREIFTDPTTANVFHPQIVAEQMKSSILVDPLALKRVNTNLNSAPNSVSQAVSVLARS